VIWFWSARCPLPRMQPTSKSVPRERDDAGGRARPRRSDPSVDRKPEELIGRKCAFGAIQAWDGRCQRQVSLCQLDGERPAGRCVFLRQLDVATRRSFVGPAHDGDRRRAIPIDFTTMR